MKLRILTWLLIGNIFLASVAAAQHQIAPHPAQTSLGKTLIWTT